MFYECTLSMNVNPYSCTTSVCEAFMDDHSLMQDIGHIVSVASEVKAEEEVESIAHYAITLTFFM